MSTDDAFALIIRRLPEYEAARTAGDRVGFGALMRAAEVAWGDLMETQGVPRGGAHSVGPAVALLVPCPCLVPLSLKRAKGNDPSEWPEDLRVREFPIARAA